MSKYPTRVKRFINKGVNPHDAVILSDIRENLTFIGGGKVRLISYNLEIKRFEEINRYSQKTFGSPTDPLEDFWIWQTDAYYKLNQNGRVTLLWYGFHKEYAFPILKQIPSNLLDLSYLKYIWLLCEVKKEKIPHTLRSNDIFEVQILPMTDEVDHFVFEIAQNSRFIDLNEFFELKIYRKDLLNQIKKVDMWLFKEAFNSKKLNNGL